MSAARRGEARRAGGGNYTLPVAGICVIEQSPENHIRKLSVSEASRHIFKQVLISRDSEESFDRFWSLLNRMMTTVDIYLLQCNRDPEASRLSYLTMRGNRMLKTKKGFLLRRLGDEFMVVAIGEASKSFNGMIRLNDTGAFYWKELEKGSSEDDLTAKTLERYEGVDQETARRDVREFLQSIEVALEHAASND